MAYKKILKICEHCKKEYMGISKNKFCSHKCSCEHRKVNITTKCNFCNKIFKITKKRLNRSKEYFCSKECHLTYRKENSSSKKECLNCKKPFEIKNHQKDKKFCSRECYHSYPKAKGKDSKKFSKVEVKCDVCNKLFFKHPSALKKTKHSVCSKECKINLLSKVMKDKTEYIIKKCSFCKKEFKRTKSHFFNRPAKNHCCSSECYYELLKEGRGGFKPFTKKCKTCNKDFMITSKNKRNGKYCSKECKEKGFPKGTEHKNFKKDLDRDYRSKHRLFHENTVWRKKVFERDLFTCQVCGKKGDKLQAHHLKNYSSNKEKRFDVKNGVTLCIDCHKQFHKIYGVVRNNEKQFKEFKNSYTIK